MLDANCSECPRRVGHAPTGRLHRGPSGHALGGGRLTSTVLRHRALRWRRPMNRQILSLSIGGLGIAACNSTGESNDSLAVRVQPVPVRPAGYCDNRTANPTMHRCNENCIEEEVETPPSCIYVLSEGDCFAFGSTNC